MKLKVKIKRDAEESMCLIMKTIPTSILRDGGGNLHYIFSNCLVICMKRTSFAADI